MGFKDGTNNILNDDQQALDEFVWAGGEGPDWMRGGNYLVAAGSRMLIGLGSHLLQGAGR